MGEIEPVFEVMNEKGMRQEIEVAYEKLNGTQFSGSITPQEAKHIIFRHCLKFNDFSNFDGVRCGFKGAPVSVFKLKKAINVDDLLPLQHFEFRRKVVKQGIHQVDIISCKIRGLRHPDQQGQRTEPKQTQQVNQVDDGTRRIKIEGCEYRIPKEVLIEFLCHYGEIISPFTEELFSDNANQEGASDGTNRTGNYLVTMRLNKEITQLSPILGRRIKIQYQGIQRQCTNCFGNHAKQNCQSQKMSWPTYIKKFMEFNPEIPDHLFGKWQKSRMSHQHSVEKNIRVEQQPDRQTKNQSSTVSETRLNAKVPSALLENDTASWVRNHSMDVPGQSSQNEIATAEIQEIRHENNNAPRETDFLIPSNPIEREQMISRMVGGGLLRSEAEQNIQNRKVAFNKACKEHKKTEQKQTRTQNRKANKTSKPVVNTSIDNGN